MLGIARGSDETHHQEPQSDTSEREIPMRRSLLWSASAIVLAGVTHAGADSPNIKGAYGFTGTAACLVAPGSTTATAGGGNPTPGVLLPGSGFQADLRPNDATPTTSTDAFTHSFAVEGIRVFNGDGTGTVKG